MAVLDGMEVYASMTKRPLLTEGAIFICLCFSTVVLGYLFLGRFLRRLVYAITSDEVNQSHQPA